MDDGGSCGFVVGQHLHHHQQQHQQLLLPGSDLAQRKDTLQSWQNLEVEIRDLQDLIATFSNIMVGVRRHQLKRMIILLSLIVVGWLVSISR